jgi:hypothetical protein
MEKILFEDTDINKIDVTKINWSKLSPEEFNKLEAEMQIRQKLIKSKQPKERNSGESIIKLKDKHYRVKMIIINRLKSMKSAKSREKLIKSIITSHNPIEEL